jgi:hypothetical protein
MNPARREVPLRRKFRPGGTAARQLGHKTAIDRRTQCHGLWTFTRPEAARRSHRADRRRRPAHAADRFGVRQIELYHNPRRMVYCLLDGPDQEAIRQHHAALGAPCGDVHQVDSLA